MTAKKDPFTCKNCGATEGDFEFGTNNKGELVMMLRCKRCGEEWGVQRKPEAS